MHIPSKIRTKTGDLKYLLIRSVKDLLPLKLISAPKRGFILPIAKWLRGPLRPQVEHFLGKDYLKRQGLFQENLYDKVVKPHIESKKNHDWQIWTVFMFQKWYEQFVLRGSAS